MIDNSQQDAPSFCFRPIPPVALAACAFIAVTTLLASSASAAPAAKVEVCHIPPGDPDNFHTITISENALAAHLAHGDMEGPCNDICATLCDDGNACTIDDTGDCEQNGCPPADPADRLPLNCDDGIECTFDYCDETEGCLSTTGHPCDDGDACTENDICTATGCQGSDLPEEEAAICCNFDTDCDPTLCNHATCVNNRCEDDEVVCDPLFCQGGACNDTTGECVYTPLVCTASEDLCFVSECSEETGGECGEVPLNCDDDNPCTDDDCDSETGCQYTDVVCDGGDFCNRPIGCFRDEGGCVYEYDPNRCDDDNPCTTDFCDPVTGCAHELIPGCCRSNADCKTCDAGICNPSTNTCDPYPDCPQGQECNDDGSIPICKPICVTAFDYQGTGDIAGFISDCQQGCPDPTICYESPTVTSCVYGGDAMACQDINEGGVSYGCHICSAPPEPDATCPCWDGSATSVNGVSNVVELWELYGPADCRRRDVCEDSNSGGVQFSQADCGAMDFVDGNLMTLAITSDSLGAYCQVEGSLPSVGRYASVKVEFPWDSPQAAACIADHDALITLGGTFPSYRTTSCGLASF